MLSERPTLTYHRVGDYYLPDLIAPEQPKIGLFGTKRFRYLRDYRSTLFNVMLLNGTLNKHLEETDQQANAMLELLIRQMAEREGVTEQLKANDQMEWGAGLRWRPLPQAEAPTEPAGETRRMNSIRNRAEEIVNSELIYPNGLETARLSLRPEEEKRAVSKVEDAYGNSYDYIYK